MNKQEFIQTLKINLGNVSDNMKNEIVYDYEEHFDIGIEKGKTEEEIATALGDPKIIAKQFKIDVLVKKAEDSATARNISSAVFAFLGLGFFNLVFVLGPFIAAISILFALFVSGISITASGIVTFLSVIASPLFPDLINTSVNLGVIFFLSIALISAGLLIFIGAIYTTRFFYKVTIHYLKFNMKIIKGGN